MERPCKYVPKTHWGHVTALTMGLQLWTGYTGKPVRGNKQTQSLCWTEETCICNITKLYCLFFFLCLEFAIGHILFIDVFTAMGRLSLVYKAIEIEAGSSCMHFIFKSKYSQMHIGL